MTAYSISRRSLFGAAASAGALLLTPARALARPEPLAPAILRGPDAYAGVRTVRLIHQRTGERYRGVYYEGGAYIPEVMSLIDWILRDVNVDRTHPMDARLIDVLGRMQQRLDVRELRVTSGYRSRETNERLRQRTGRAAKNSFHIEGMAADVYNPSVSTRCLARAARAEGAGGVGFYPSHGFVHVDVGPERNWRG